MSLRGSSLERPESRLLAGSAVLAALVALAAPALAPAQQYEVFRQPEVMRPLPLEGGTATKVFTQTEDNTGVRINMPQGFSFKFYNKTFTNVVVGSNGFLQLSGNPIYGEAGIRTGGIFDLEATSGTHANPKELVAVWLGDAKCWDGDVKWQTLGNAPYRTVIIEWNCSYAHATAVLPIWRAQAWLTEGSGTISVLYGTYSPGPGDYGWAKVGVRDVTVASSPLFTYGLTCGANCSATNWPDNTRVTYSMGPELVVSEVKLPPEGGFAGTTMPVSVTVRNTGGAPARDFTVQLYLNTAPTKNGNEMPIGMAQVRQTAEAARSTVFSMRPMIPVGVPQGQYYVIAEADPDRAVPKADLGRAVASSAKFDVGIPAPNLAPLAVTAPATIEPGTSFLLGWTAANLGNSPAYGAEYQVVLSTSDTPSASARVLEIEGPGGARMDRGILDLATALNPPLVDRLYADVPMTTKVFLPGDVPEGRYYIGVRMDPDMRVFEHERSNNTAVSKQTLVAMEGTVHILTEPTLPEAEAGSPYSVALRATGGDGTYVWKLGTGSRLPPGLSIQELPAGARDLGLPFSTFLSGTPTTVGSFEFTLEVTSAAAADSVALSLTVVPQVLPLTIHTRQLPTAIYGVPYETRFVAGGGKPPYLWTVESGTLPAGLDLRLNGVLEGTPRADGNFPFTVRVTDDDGRSVTQAVVLPVLAPSAPVCPVDGLPMMTLGEPVNFQLQAGGGPAKTWSTKSVTYLPGGWGETVEPPRDGATPPGLEVKPDGHVVGTPTRVGAYDWLVGVQEEGATNELACSIRVEVLRDRNLSVATQALPEALVDATYNAKLEASGGEGALKWSLWPSNTNPLPAGLSLSDDGVLTGTPSLQALGGLKQANFAFMVRVVDEKNRYGTGSLSIDLRAEPRGGGPGTTTDKTSSCQSAGAEPSLLAVAAALAVAGIRRRRRS